MFNLVSFLKLVAVEHALMIVTTHIIRVQSKESTRITYDICIICQGAGFRQFYLFQIVEDFAEQRQQDGQLSLLSETC